MLGSCGAKGSGVTLTTGGAGWAILYEKMYAREMFEDMSSHVFKGRRAVTMIMHREMYTSDRSESDRFT